MECYQPPVAAMDHDSRIDNYNVPVPSSGTPSDTEALPATPPPSNDLGVDENLRCRYANKKCMNPRTAKRTGGLHTFCDEHRENANRNQRRLDQKKRKEKRQQESIQSYFETLQAVEQESQTAAQSFHPNASQPMHTVASSMMVEPLRQPVPLLDEDVDALVSLFGPSNPHHNTLEHEPDE